MPHFDSVYRLPTAIAVLVPLLGLTAACANSSDDADGDVDLVITAPDADGLVSERQVQFEGTVQGASVVEVEGVAADVDGDHWEADVVFEDDGPQQATATAGDVETTVDFTIDTVVPTVEVHSPPRGTVLDADDHPDATVDLQGEVSDIGPSGLDLLDVDGRQIDVDDDGAFHHEIAVDEGFNLLTVTATDGARNQLQTSRAVLYGPLADPQDAIDDAAELVIDNPSGIDTLTDVIQSYLTADQIHEFVAVGFQEADIPVDITDIHWDELDLQLSPEQGVLTIDIAAEGLRVDGQFDYDDNSDPLQGYIEIDELDVELQAEVGVDDERQLQVDVIDDQITTDGVTVDLDGDQEDWLADAVEIAIAIAFEEFVAELIEDNLYDPEALTHDVEFLDQTIEITLLLDEIIVSSQGIAIGFGVDFPDHSTDAGADVAGALHRPVGSASSGSADRPFLFHTDRSAVDRLLDAIWRTELFHQQLGNDELSAVDLPFDLTADGLASLLDTRIRNLHDRHTPARLQLRPLLAPTIEFGGGEEATAYIGDFLVDVYLLPDGDDDTLVLTVALHLEVDLQLEIEDNEIGFDFDIHATGDIADEPQFRFDRADTIDFITDIIEVVPDLLESDLAIDAQATLDWAIFDDPLVHSHGSDNEELTIGIDVEAADNYIEDDDIGDDDDD